MSNEAIPTPTPSAPETSAPEAASNITPNSPNGGEALEAQVEVLEEAEAVLEDPTASKQEKAAAKKMLKKLKIKVDGEEFEEELPYEIPDTPEAVEYTRKQIQLAKMAHKRAQEKSQIEKDAMELINMLKTDPESVLSDPTIGVDVKKLAAQIIEKEIERAKKSPEQLALEEAQAELRKMKEQAEKEKKAASEREKQALEERYHKEFESQISKAFDSNKIPKSPIALKSITDYMEFAIQLGKDVSIDDLIPLVREELTGGFKKHLDALPEDELETFLGKPLIDKLRKKNIARAKQANSNPAVKGGAKVANVGKTEEKQEPQKKITIKEWLKV